MYTVVDAVDAEDDEHAERLEQIQDSLVASYMLGVGGGANVLAYALRFWFWLHLLRALRFSFSDGHFPV